MQDRRAGRTLLVHNVGASVSAKAPDRTQGSHPFGWRDAMDVIVRWRQLAEPNDQVSQGKSKLVSIRWLWRGNFAVGVVVH